MRYPVELSPREDRLQSLDVLRGVAVLGILVMNIYAFAMPWAAYANPLAMGGTGPLDLGTWFLTHLLFDQKFMSIFSMLFGAGVAMMVSRCEAKGADAAPLFFRRQGWLFVIGMLHAYLLWFGDILVFYAVVGTLTWLFRHQPAHRLLMIAMVVLPVAPLLANVGGIYLEELKTEAEAIQRQLADGEPISEEQQQTLDEWLEQRIAIAPTEAEIQEDVAAYRSDYRTIFEHRAPFVTSVHVSGILYFGLWRIGGLMLIGMALYKLGTFTPDCPAGVYRRFMIAGYGVGLPLCLLSGINLQAHDFDPLYTFRAGGFPNYVGSIFVAFGHLGVVLAALRRGWLPRFKARLAAVGRMALSNYLLQSLVMTTIFYGYGLGLYAEVGRTGQMLFVAGLGALQLWVSALWLKGFRFGPAEWLWRSLSYCAAADAALKTARSGPNGARNSRFGVYTLPFASDAWAKHRQ
ncbi:MAG: DUF418 domain-containing protein [Pseudomonadota bacterium]